MTNLCNDVILGLQARHLAPMVFNQPRRFPFKRIDSTVSEGKVTKSYPCSDNTIDWVYYSDAQDVFVKLL